MSFRTILFTGALVSTALAFSACEWSGGSDGGFNTSRVDFNVNISGQYTGLLAGGKAVANTSGAPINRLLVQQSGNAVEVTDTYGNMYRGSVGAPGAIADFGTVIPSGASVASFQVGWRGTDNTAGREVEFSGVVNLITVENVQGDTSTQTSSSNNSSESVSSRENGSTRDSASTSANASSSAASNESSEDTDSSGTVGGEGSGSTQTITVVEPTGNGTTNVTTIVTTTPGENIVVNTAAATSSTTSSDQSSERGNSSDSSNTSAASSSSSQSSQTASDSTRTITSTFSISEANSQFRLQGTWIEQGGLVSPVEARSPGTATVLTTTTTQGTN